MCVLLIMQTADTLPLAICLPALYAILADRLNRKFAMLFLILAPAALLVIPGMLTGFILYACLIFCGMLLHTFTKQGNVGTAVMAPAILLLTLFALNVAFASHIKGISVQIMISQWIGSVLNEVSNIYSQNFSQEVLKEFIKTRAVMEQWLGQLFWGITASFFMGMMWINLLLASRLSKEKKLRDWQTPDWAVGIFILACILVLIRYETPHVLGLNLMIVVMQVYFFNGMGIVASGLIGYNWTPFLRWVIYILILTQIYIMIGIAALGLFDTWFNFRKMIRKAEGDKT